MINIGMIGLIRKLKMVLRNLSNFVPFEADAFEVLVNVRSTILMIPICERRNSAASFSLAKIVVFGYIFSLKELNTFIPSELLFHN